MQTTWQGREEGSSKKMGSAKRGIEGSVESKKQT